MKIALVQTKIVWEDKEKNISAAESMAASEASHKDIDMVLFPEMSFTGFSMDTEKTKEDGAYTLSRMRRIAANNGVSIGFGWVKDCGEKCENHYTVVDGKGAVLFDYVKIHPFSYSGEDKFFHRRRGEYHL